MKAKKTNNIKIFGIRHHGPGSSLSLINALNSYKPDAIAIELPADEGDIVQQLMHDQVRLPVAWIIYKKGEYQEQAVIPFADFSPEWQGLQYAKECDIPIRRIDLPWIIQRQILKSASFSKSSESALQKVAKIAGYENIESWWDEYMERKEQPLESFDQIMEIMKWVRDNESTSLLNATREAFMRKQLRELSKKYERIAVICGAYHSPALADWDNTETVGEDAKLTNSLKTSKVEMALIPFSYRRLTKEAGYGAGVQSPLLYHYLYHYKEKAAEFWLSHAAKVLRKEGFTPSTDEISAAIRLSEQLSHLRKMEQPGLDELIESTQPTICAGHTERFELIRHHAIVGEYTGSIPTDLIRSPFIDDFLKSVKKYRLSKYWKQSEGVLTKELDLRKKMHLQCSKFLWKLQIMHFPWANPGEVTQRSYGTFREVWRFEKDAESEIYLHNISGYGSNCQQVASHFLEKQLEEDQILLSDIVQLLDLAILADMEGEQNTLLKKIYSMAAGAEDLPDLLSANTQMLQIAKYGNVRDPDRSAIFRLAGSLHEKICVGMPFKVTGLSDELSRDLLEIIATYSLEIKSMEAEEFLAPWIECFLTLDQNEDKDSRIDGYATRLLLDYRQLGESDFQKRLQAHLSSTYSPLPEVLWLEGLLYGNSNLLIYHAFLLERINEWVGTIDNEHFDEILPILGRIFSGYSRSEREQLFQKVKHGDFSSREMGVSLDSKLNWAENQLKEAMRKLF